MFWAANISEIRKLAEEKLGKQPTQLKKLTAQDAEKLIHELQVHQIELEIQNEELRTAQLALDEARQKYFDLYNLAPVGYITLSEDGLITGANQTAVELFSVEKKQLENKPFTEFIISEDQNSFYLYKRQQLESNKQQQLELRLKKNHKVFWALLESVIIRNGNGSISMQVSIDNITARKQAEAELQLSEMKYRNLVDAMSEGLGVQDEDGKITFINKQGCDLLGYELDELIGKPITLVFDEENQKILQEQMILRHKGEL